MGRPTVHTPEMAEKICKHLADGMTLRAICRMEGFPPQSTVREWALDDRSGFTAQYMRARELGYHEMAEELLEVSDDGTNDWMEREGKDGEGSAYDLNGEHVTRSRLRVDTRKWLLSKALPKIYGDKLETTLRAGDGMAELFATVAGNGKRITDD